MKCGEASDLQCDTGEPCVQTKLATFIGKRMKPDRALPPHHLAGIVRIGWRDISSLLQRKESEAG